ncbi:MAG TPA: hypothetical protein VFU48_01455, partial [Nitrospira sp.]|nr:hypothetical protein [Nitrospira sp.]
MKLISLTHPVQASWLREMSYRMDASPFVSGALEARKTLEALNVRKDELHTLTAGHEGGIFNGPHFSRTYVDAPEHGVPFVGSSDMLSADLSHLPLLRRKDAISSKLAYLELTPGMTLISCSGTIGRTVYSRDEMKGMWSSQHIMKVVPDEEKVPPGYLYAFISCKFGIPIVVSGTYGSIIQSIQPEHIATLPVPRFGRDLEGEVHALIQKAAYERTAAANMIRSAAGSFDSLIRDVDLRRTSPRISIVSSLQLQARM